MTTLIPKTSLNKNTPSITEEREYFSSGSKKVLDLQTYMYEELIWFKNIDLYQFCAKPLFEVVLIKEMGKESFEFLKEIVQLSKQNKNSNFIFVSKMEVFEMLEKGISKENFEYPQKLQNILFEIANELEEIYPKTENISNKATALLIKHTLIYFMYLQYKKDVEIEVNQQTREKLLQILAFSKNAVNYTPLNKIDILPPTKLPPIDFKEKNQIKMIDFSSYPLEKIDKNEKSLCNQTYFYVLYDFDDPAIIYYLKKIKVPVSTILKLTTKNETDLKNLFWEKIKTINLQNYKYFCNSAFMSYSIDLCNNNIYKKALHEIEKIISSIVEIKLTHLNYIKNLKYTKSKSELILPPFKIYQEFLQALPIEYCTIPVILEGILRQIDGFFEENQILPMQKLKPLRLNRECPFNFNYYLRNRCPKKLDIKKNEVPKFFENDELNINASFYKTGLEAYLIKIYLLNKLFNICNTAGQKIEERVLNNHLHTTSAPKSPINNANKSVDYFINALYVNSITCNKNTTKINLFPYLIKNDPDSLLKMHVVSDFKCELNTNFYENFDSLVYYWTEKLKKSALACLLHEAEINYSCSDYKFCLETNTIIVLFHQNVDCFGCRHVPSFQSVRSVVSLNEFCCSTLCNDKEWIQNNIKNNEKCEQKKTLSSIFKKIIRRNSFEEFNELLRPTTIFCNKCSSLKCDQCHLSENDDIEEKFDVQEPISEIKNYMLQNDLTIFCKNPDSSSGIKAFANEKDGFTLTGCKHEFISHDGVKIEVDNSKFLKQSFRLSASIAADKNIFYFQVSKKKLGLHMYINNGTIITFINNYNNQITNLLSSSTCSAEPSFVSQSSSLQNSFHSLHKVKQKHSYSKCTLCPSISLGKYIRVSTSKIYKIQNNQCRRRDQPLLDRKMTLIKLLKSQSTVFIEDQIRKYCRLKMKPVLCSYKPFTRIVDRIFMKKKRSYPTRFCKIKGCRQSALLDLEVQVTLPSGLNIETVYHNNNVCIKQSYTYGAAPEVISNELYRLFFEDGIILVRYKNGDMKILDVKNKIVNFSADAHDLRHPEGEKPCCHDSKRCCKLMRNFMKDKQDFPTAYEMVASSRRHIKGDTIVHKIKSQEDFVLRNFPYHNISVFKKDGTRLNVAKCVTEKKINKMYIERNLWSYEIFVTRSDGLSSLLNSNGQRIIKYPDGTIITSDYVMDETCLENGWINIQPIFYFQHPYYLPLKYHNKTRQFQLLLNNHIEVFLNKKQAQVKTPDLVKIDIDCLNVAFCKSCTKCEGKFDCKINLHPYFNNKIASTETLLTCTDSYEKHICFNYLGECFKKQSYIKTRLNRFGCDHVSKNEYQKIFLIRPDGKGYLLWNDTMVQEYLQNVEEKDTADYKLERKLDAQGLETITCTRNWSVPHNQRFFWTEQMPLLGHTSNLEIQNDIAYQTIRLLKRMTNKNDVKNMKQVLEKCTLRR